MPQLLFGGLLATILLGFYIWSIVDAIAIATCKADCRQFSTEMSFLLNSLGGLISATVVGVLGATQPGEYPSKKLFEKNLTGMVKTVAAYMPSAYILVWVFCGVIMLIVFVKHPDAVPPLSAQAKVWFGSAIAAVYAYFGITPDGKPVDRPAVANIAIAPANINLTAAAPTQTLSATATDAQKNTIPNLPNDRFEWKSDNNAVATVDQTGLVTWVGIGNCNVTATANANAVVSNNCTVKCD